MSEQEELGDKSSPRFEPQGNVVKAKDFTDWKTGAEYLEAAREEAKKIVAQARTDAVKVHEDAYQNAIKMVESERANEDMVVSAQVHLALREMEQDFLTLVLQTTRKVIGEIPHPERAAMLASKAFDQFKEGRQVTVKVHPDAAETTRLTLNAKLQETGLGASSVKIIADQSLQPGDCIIQTNRGVTRADINSQLEIVHRNFQYRLEG